MDVKKDTSDKEYRKPISVRDDVNELKRQLNEWSDLYYWIASLSFYKADY